MVDVEYLDTAQSDVLIAEQAPRCRGEVEELFIDDKALPVPVTQKRKMETLTLIHMLNNNVMQTCLNCTKEKIHQRLHNDQELQS